VGDTEAIVQLPAWLPCLGYLEQRAADPQLVAEAQRLFGEAQRAQVLAEGARCTQYRTFPDFVDPLRVVLERVEMNGLVGTAVKPRVTLLVAVQAVETDVNPARAKLLCDRAAAARASVGNGAPGQYRLDAPDRCR